MADLIAAFQDLVAQVPLLVQPLIIALAGAVPFIEGEGSALIGVIGGVHPVVAALAGIAGNLLCVTLVVLLGSRTREAVVSRQRARRAAAVPVAAGATVDAALPAEEAPTPPESKGRRRLKRWLLRFGVPGASLLAPLALPTPFTAATLAASGVRKGWVILWQGIAIVLWTTLVTVGAVGLVAAAEG